MYLNVLSFENGKTLAFQTKVPFSLDKLTEEWVVITDDSNGQVISFKSSKVVTIASVKAEEVRKKKGLTTRVVEK